MWAYLGVYLCRCVFRCIGCVCVGVGMCVLVWACVCVGEKPSSVTGHILGVQRACFV